MPEQDAPEIVTGWLALFMPYETKRTVTLRHVLEARIADALRAPEEKSMKPCVGCNLDTSDVCPRCQQPNHGSGECAHDCSTPPAPENEKHA